MSNNFTYQILSDTNKRTVIKLTGELDANGETNNTKIIGAQLSGALAVDSNNMVTVAMGGTPRTTYRYGIGRIVYDINLPSTNAYVKLAWDGSQPATIACINDGFDLNMQDNLGLMNNNAGTPNGNITLTTVGVNSNSSYTIIIELYKNPLDYNQGQIQMPQDFNIRGVTPPGQNRAY